MQTMDFATWLQGWVELNGGKMPTEEQWEMIKAHLKLHFTKVTPPFPEGGPPVMQKWYDHTGRDITYPLPDPLPTPQPSMPWSPMPDWYKQFPPGSIIC